MKSPCLNLWMGIHKRKEFFVSFLLIASLKLSHFSFYGSFDVGIKISNFIYSNGTL